MTRSTEQDILIAIRAARHFQLIANGRLKKGNTVAAFSRDAQALADALAAIGFVATPEARRTHVHSVEADASTATPASISALAS